MNLFFRLIQVMFAAVFRSQVGVLEETAVSFRVWPNDLDVNLHMNNGRYLTLMDLGRMDLTVRCGLARQILKRKWRPMVGAETIRFKRGLAPFEKYMLTTRIIGWDEKWFYLEQRFVSRGRICAVAWLKALFRGPEGNVPIQEIMDSVGATTPAPEVPSAFLEWLRTTENMGV